MLVVARQVAVARRRSAEDDVGAQVVATGLAELAVAARHARLDGHAVAYHQVLDFSAALETWKGLSQASKSKSKYLYSL